MATGRDYMLTMRTGADGTLYVLVRELPLAASGWPVRDWAPALAEILTMLKAGFQKALRFASRRA